jgi:hypothetical protein
MTPLNFDGYSSISQSLLGIAELTPKSFPRNPKTDMEREHKEGYLPQFLLVE